MCESDMLPHISERNVRAATISSSCLNEIKKLAKCFEEVGAQCSVNADSIRFLIEFLADFSGEDEDCDESHSSQIGCCPIISFDELMLFEDEQAAVKS